MPAAVPLTAAITGFSQSRTAATRRWAPVADHAGDVAGHPLGGALGAGGTGARGPQVGAGAEVLPGGADDHGPDLDPLAGLGEQVDQPVALVGRDGVGGLGPVEGDPAARPRRRGPHLLVERAVLGVGHGPER